MSAPFSNILVAVDFSPTSRRAVELARDLVKAAGPAHLILAHAHFVPLEIEALAVRGVERVFADIEKQAKAQLDEIVAELTADGVSAEAVALEGIAEDVLLKLAEDRHADLIVMGTHGRTGLGHALLGSIAERVVRGARCPVLTAGRPG